ncbi:MAG: radical SAM/SPASM domain-containing protein [Bacteroidota bacterium]
MYSSFYLSRYRKKSFHKGNPLKIGIEPTTFCNLRCPECPSGLRSFTRPTGMMDIGNFQRLIDQLSPDLVYLLLYFQGEPYLHPQFLDMVSYANNKKIYTATSTNGHYLTEERAQKTVESGLSEIIISVDGATQESYEKYRKGGKLDKVLAGIERLVRSRKALKSLSPHIILQFLVVRHNEHEISNIKALGKSLGVDTVALKSAQIYNYQEGSELMPQNTKYSRYYKGKDGKYHIKNPLENQCWKLWQGAEVTWDGKVLPCCFDKDAQHVMGQFPDTPFDQIWNSPIYQTFRNSLLYSRQNIKICQNCSEGMRVWK